MWSRARGHVAIGPLMGLSLERREWARFPNPNGGLPNAYGQDPPSA